MSVARPEWRRRRVVLGITHVLLCFMTTTTGLTSLSCCDAFQSFDATAKKRCMMRITSPSRLFLVDKPEREDEDDVPMSLLSLFPELSDMKADIQSLMSTKDDKEAILQANRIVNVRKRLLRRMLEMQEEDKPPKEEKGFAPKPKKKKRKSKKKQALPPVVTSLLPPNKEEIDEITQKLPSIADLFPPNSMSKTEETNNGASLPSSSSSSSNRKTTPTMEGVLPVSDLFYRSSQSINEDDKYPSKPSPRGDDEELPFSAEQSDQLTTHHNRIQIRRNQATQQRQTELNTSKTKQNTPRKRRLVRRGIEMLVGGVPINADPPQRCIELHYKYKNPQRTSDWADTITINTPDFGPMLYNYSVSELSDTEKGLYCEYFVNSTLKWNVCPKDLRTIARQFSNQNDGSAGINIFDFDEDSMAAQILKNVDEITGIFRSFVADDSSQALGAMKDMDSMSPQNDDDDDDDNSYLMGELVFSIGVSKEELQSCDAGASDDEKPVFERVLERGIVNSCPDCTGFGVTFTKLLLSDLGDGTTKVIADFNITMSDEETANTRNAAVLRKKCQNIHTALAQAMDDGTMQFAMAAAASAEEAWPEELRNRVTEEFLIDEDTDSNDDGYDGTDEFKDAASLFAGLNESELKELKSTVSSMLGDGDFKLMDVKTGDVSTVDSLLADAPYKILGFGDDIENELLTPKRQLSLPSKNDLFFGGENDGVFWNYAESNALKAPYQGRLGLRLVEAVVEKAKHRHPRVIAIGDVHGCIDELQDLLRECDYRPGDLVVFLGDLVCKGPDSVAVVQMAREINALSCRGNHDFECLRWGQAIKAGVDPPIAVSEHFHIANSLTKADMKWMYNLPWYISSPDLGALFVHAGFVSGIRLAKQNPRLMMNMRSILPDGTVTSKFFNNWPWARLWDGPQTVLFGHDADRGLQQYEHAIGLDTGCVYGGRLTACILPEKRLVSVNARKSYFQYRRKHFD